MQEHDFTMTAEYLLIRSMRTMPSSKKSRTAFTLTELCVVITCVAILAMLVLPALAAGKMQSASAGCLDNLRHLMVGWEMYRTENNDYLMPNSPLGSHPGTNAWVSSQAAENWAYADANTNPVYYTSSLMWRYVNNDLSVYRCPGDVVPSANGTRIRSYSMNGQVGSTTSQFYNAGDLIYLKGSDIIRPTLANLFVFADESMWTLNDGYLQMGLNSPDFPDVPANYHGDGNCFSFADGHVEYHRWRSTLLKVPYAYGVSGTHWPTGAGLPPLASTDPDWTWVRQHASSHQ